MTGINAIAETKEHQELKVPESDLKQRQSKRKSERAKTSMLLHLPVSGRFQR